MQHEVGQQCERVALSAEVMRPNLALVVAMAENRVIGCGGGLPWHLPNDLRHFKQLTIGKIVLMGRRTWASLGRPLPQRQNWVVSRNPDYSAEGARVFPSVEAALGAAGDDDVMAIGGADVFRRTLPLARRLHLTLVHAQVDGDTWFPEFDAGAFRQVEREDHAADARHAHAYSFITLERIAA